MSKLTLYTRVDCHLCEDAKAVLDRVRARVPFELAIIDVDTNEELQSLYGLEVPVVMIDDKKWAKFRVDEAALEKRLRSAT